MSRFGQADGDERVGVGVGASYGRSRAVARMAVGVVAVGGAWQSGSGRPTDAHAQSRARKGESNPGRRQIGTLLNFVDWFCLKLHGKHESLCLTASSSRYRR